MISRRHLPRKSIQLMMNPAEMKTLECNMFQERRKKKQIILYGRVINLLSICSIL